MRWVRTTFIGIFLFLTALSCESPTQTGLSTSPEVDIDLEEIKNRGHITALVDNNSVSYFIYKGVPMGYEYELLNLFAKELGVTLRFE